jgi:hypothetical protein
MAGSGASKLAYKPAKILANWLGANRATALSAARGHLYVMIVYGNVMAAIEVDCATHCICKDDYNGGNLFDVQEAVDFYMDALF